MHTFEIITESAAGRKLLSGDHASIAQLSDTGEDTVRIRFDAESFRKSLRTLRSLTQSAAETEGTVFRAGGRTLSASAMLDIFDRVTRHEQRITEERQRNDLRPDGWGYSALDAITRYLPENREELFTGAFWFQFGSFISDGVWKVDKHQILAILKQQAEDELLHLCPSFDFTVTEGIIGRLPDTIDTNENPNWSVLYVREAEGSRVRKRPKGIVHKLTRAGGSPRDSETGRNGEFRKEERKRNIPKVSFEDIGGIENIINRVREVIELPLRNPGMFKHLGIRPHKGVMLHGEPGCGKTMVAKAIAHEVEAHFMAVKGPELINKYQGASEENLRKLFDEAREMQPSIIFFDEMDAIAQRRSDAETLRTDARFVNQLLSVMDGVEDYGRICVIGATNRIELIDPALLRPGRFDYQLEVSKPDEEGCRKIFRIVTRDMPLDPDLDLDAFGRGLAGLTGAEIAFIAREAAYNTLRRTLKTETTFEGSSASDFDYSDLSISSDDLNEARKKLFPEDQNR